MATTNFVNGTVVQADWLNDVDAHVYDQVLDAHDAANISFVPAGTVTSTTVQAAIEEVSAEAAAATIASNVVFTPTGTIAATDVQAALAELDTQVSDNLTATNAAIVAVKIQDQTPVATTSGTSIDITGIPAGIKRLIVKLVGVSTNGTSDKVIRLGTSGGVLATGYLTGLLWVTTTSPGASSPLATGWQCSSALAADTLSGALVLDLHGTDVWVATGGGSATNRAHTFVFTGHVDIGGVLDRVRITTLGGTDTFDAGEVSISWEF